MVQLADSSRLAKLSLLGHSCVDCNHYEFGKCGSILRARRKKKSETQSTFESYPEWGKSEWKAKTLEDVKQMAIDFAEGVG
ncbi:MAG: hypothetical protein ACOCQD_02120 [archaeon]